MVSDLFGRAVLDWARGGHEFERVERDDGYADMGAGPEVYLARSREWPSVERRAMRFARGRIVDVGCGAGRVALHLQDRGFDVLAIDRSHLAVRACRLRGVRSAKRMELETLGPSPFDTFILFGNNFGVFGTVERARDVLSDWARRSPPGARILAESMHPYRGGPGLHRAPPPVTRRPDRMPGEMRLRFRYRGAASPWFDWFFVSPSEMRRVVRHTGWGVRQVLGPEDSGLYVAVLEK